MSNIPLQDGVEIKLNKYIKSEPHDHQKATLALCRAAEAIDPKKTIEILYGGAAGSGKSELLLMSALEYCDQPDYAALILRLKLKDLEQSGALQRRSKEWLMDTDATWRAQVNTWEFPSGARLSFGYCDKADDIYQYQGAEWQFIGFDELTQFDEDHYDFIRLRLRRKKGSTVPIRLLSTSNPGGRGHMWVRKRFPVNRKRNEGDPYFVPAKVWDNPYIDEMYVDNLKSANPVLSAHLLDGNWDIFVGSAFDMFRDEFHVIPEKNLPKGKIPPWWSRFESMDFGVTNPTAWYLYTVDEDDNVIVMDEYYSSGDIELHARTINENRSDWWEIKGDGDARIGNICYAPMDVKGRSRTNRPTGYDLTIEDDFVQWGIGFAMAQMDRKTSLTRVRELLTPRENRKFPIWHHMVGEEGSPRLFISNRCVNLIQQLASAVLEKEGPLMGEAVDSKWETKHGHAIAALRYGTLSWFPFSQRPIDDEEELDARTEAFNRRREALSRKPEDEEYESIEEDTALYDSGGYFGSREMSRFV